MGRDRHYYNAKGDYRGFSSDEPPREPKNWTSRFVVGGILFVSFAFAYGFGNMTALLIVGTLGVAAIYGLYCVLQFLFAVLSDRFRERKHRDLRGDSQITYEPGPVNLALGDKTLYSTQCRDCRREVAPLFIGQNGRAKYSCQCGRDWVLRW